MRNADIVSLVRIVFGPFFAFLLALQIWNPGEYLGVIEKSPPIVILFLFLSLVLTDWFDGRIAREEGTTRFGKWLDPFCDKLLVWPFRFALFPLYHWSAQYILIFALIMDFISEAQRVYNYNKTKEIGANWFGKFKTGFAFVEIPFMLIVLSVGWHNWIASSLLILAHVCLFSSTFLSLLSLKKKFLRSPGFS